jgi:hypothetical protein
MIDLRVQKKKILSLSPNCLITFRAADLAATSSFRQCFMQIRKSHFVVCVTIFFTLFRRNSNDDPSDSIIALAQDWQPQA